MDPQTPSNLPDDERLDAYFAGELDAADAEQVRRQLASRPDAERLLRRADAFTPQENLSQRDVNVAAMWRTMERRIHDAEPKRKGIARRAPARMWRMSAMGMAAALALLIGGTQWWRASHDGESTALDTKEYATHRGERATVNLADGSAVQLAPESRLQVRSVGGKLREVELNGQAYFTIKNDAHAPFMVRAGDGIVRVLGTEFAVRRYPEDSTVRVTVASGRVSLRDRIDRDGIGVILGATDVATLGPRNRVMVVRGGNVAEELAWRTGQLRFRGTSADAFVREVGRTYDLDIQIRDSVIAQRTVTSTLHATTASGALEVISQLLDVAVHRDGQRVILTKRTAP